MSLVGFFLPLHTNVLSLLALAPTLSAPTVTVDEPAHDPLDDAQHAIALEPTSGPYAMQPGNPTDFVAPLDPDKLGDKILFVNFDGADMNACSSGPQNNCSSLFFGTVLPYSGDAAKRATVVQIVRARVEDFGVTVTDTRPGSGDYDMEMVGDWAGAGDQEFAGVAPGPIDCNDSRGGQVSFTLEASGTSDGIAEIILQEVAHTWGLEHIDDQQDLLYPTTQGQNKIFKDECLQIVRLENDGVTVTPTGASCGFVHSQFCGSNTMQNSYQELLNLFGPSVPDTTAPTVQILEPVDGSMVGPDVNLRIQFEDNQSPIIINATIIIESDSLPETVENDGAYAGPSELDFPINGLPGGVYTVTIDAVDEDDNPASDTVTFTVEGDPPSNTSNGSGNDSDGESSGDVETSGTGDGGSDSNGSGNNDDDDDDDNGGDTFGDTDGGNANEGGDEGCGCTTDTPRPMGWAALSLFGILALRRRR